MITEENFRQKLLMRFLRYVQIHTTSDPESTQVPSTPEQLVFAQDLAEELRTIGLEDVQCDTQGYVTASLPANSTQPQTMGWIAHMDTSKDAPGKNVRPQVHENYNGQPIALGNGKILDPQKSKQLAQYKTHTLITTDGTTLLGADDKAGVAIIVTAAEYLLAHPSIPRPRIRLGFTPDEEIGRGADHFDVQGFGADYAYTLDGAGLGELEYENFNAASATITFIGENIHPGYAYGKMINALYYASAFVQELPEEETPENTNGYFGFFHLHTFKGDVAKAELHYLIREFDQAHFQERKELLIELVKEYEKIIGKGRIQIKIEDQYLNMHKQILPHFHIIEEAQKAMQDLEIKPVIRPIRGGTDGARLSYMGLPCPNLFTGMENIHSVYDFISLDVMEKSMKTLVKIAENKGKI